MVVSYEDILEKMCNPAPYRDDHSVYAVIPCRLYAVEGYAGDPVRLGKRNP